MFKKSYITDTVIMQGTVYGKPEKKLVQAGISCAPLPIGLYTRGCFIKRFIQPSSSARHGRAKVCGEVAEWLKAHAWKACRAQALEGSNPSLSAICPRLVFRSGYGAINIILSTKNIALLECLHYSSIYEQPETQTIET